MFAGTNKRRCTPEQGESEGIWGEKSTCATRSERSFQTLLHLLSNSLHLRLHFVSDCSAKIANRQEEGRVGVCRNTLTHLCMIAERLIGLQLPNSWPPRCRPASKLLWSVCSLKKTQQTRCASQGQPQQKEGGADKPALCVPSSRNLVCNVKRPFVNIFEPNFQYDSEISSESVQIFETNRNMLDDLLQIVEVSVFVLNFFLCRSGFRYKFKNANLPIQIHNLKLFCHTK